MTTPERLRRRQLIEGRILMAEGIALVVLALVTILLSVHSSTDLAAQRDCFRSYLASQAQTQKVRGALLDAESRATRRVISRALTAKTPADVDAARIDYRQALERIDRGRVAHPVESFTEASCRR